MKKFIPALIFAVFTFGCTTAEDLSSHKAFTEIIGKELHTKRITYLYDMNGDGIFELWDNIYRYGQGLNESEKMEMHSKEPLEEIPIGAPLVVEKVVREIVFDNPPGIVALGRLQLETKSVPFRYLLGLKNEIKEPPWESSVYDPQKRTPIEPIAGGDAAR